MGAWRLVAAGDQVAFTRCQGQRYHGDLPVRRECRGQLYLFHDWRTPLTRRSFRNRNDVIDNTSRRTVRLIM